MPFPFFFATIVFVVILTYFLRKGKTKQDEVMKAFWERERESNASRRKDIESLPYLEVPDTLFANRIDTDTEQKLLDLASSRMLNLTDQSNTDLKLAYGPQNLEVLSECDNRFVEFSGLLPVYAQELLDRNHTDSATAVLEYGVQNQCDNSKIYTMLAELYVQKQTPERVSELITASEALSKFSHSAIEKKLQAYLP